MPDDQDIPESQARAQLQAQAPGSPSQWFRQQRARSGMLLRGQVTAQQLRRPQPEPEE